MPAYLLGPQLGLNYRAFDTSIVMAIKMTKFFSVRYKLGSVCIAVTNVLPHYTIEVTHGANVDESMDATNMASKEVKALVGEGHCSRENDVECMAHKMVSQPPRKRWIPLQRSPPHD